MSRISSIGVSVVICCYNSAAQLPRTLHHIACQNVSRHISWEVILVDNASTDNTTAVAREVWEKTGCETPFKIVKQDIPGLSAAREKGLEQSRYEFLLFCDDDNWLDKGYVDRAYETMILNPSAAVLGGKGEAVSKVALPEWFRNYAIYYAVGPQGDCSGDVTNAKGYVYGAGFVVRKSVWIQLQRLGFKSQLTGRKGNSLTSSEDRELCYALRLLGYRIWYHDQLTFKHHISVDRLEWEYFLRLVQAGHRARPHMDAYLTVLNGQLPPKSLRRSWIWQCQAIIKKFLKNPNLLIALSRSGEGNLSVLESRRLVGDWQGWWSVRESYTQIFETVNKLRILANTCKDF